MLQILRNKAQSTFIQVIVVIIALVFIFWGVGTNMLNTREVALTVNDEEITFQQFQEAYDQAIGNLGGQFGGALPKGLEESLGIKQQVIEQLIQSSLLRQGAADMGIRISAEEVRDRITSLPQFQQAGQFNMERYQSLLAANRLTPTTFESSMRHDMLSDRTVQDIGKFVTLVPQTDIEDLHSQQNETVSVQFVRIDSASFKKDIKVEKSDLQKWFDSVKDNYRTAPEIKLRYLAYTFDDLGQKITVDDKQIQAHYADNIDSYKTPEQRRARHILLTASAEDSPERHQEQQKKAAEIIGTLKKNNDFASIANKYSDDSSKENGGDLGFFSRGSMVPEFDAKVFSMQPGEISDIVKTEFGYHIIKLEEVKPSATRPLEEVRAEIVQTIKNREAKRMAFQLANAAYEGIIKAGSLKTYTDAHPDADLKETDFFVQKQPPKEIGANQKLLDAAFALNKGELSSLIETDTGYAILFAVDKKPPVVPPLETVEEKVKADFISSKAQEKARATAASMIEQLKKGKTLEQLTTGTAFQVTASGDLSRSAANQTSAFPTDLHAQAFTLSKSSPLPKEVAQVGGAFYVYVFQERKPPAKKADDQAIQQYREALVRFNQQQLLTAWIRNLENQAKIRRHKNL
ncbi:MAG: SurA N-terminal domain-containing protein [Desulfoprunum sp.]|uniref:SurA N-terminal domain-containing protein n=1 Tax=Desulfoprunum sp. TaxID=2020866 RepID=UPI003C790DDA